MWGTEQRSEFDERGFVRLRGVFSRVEAAAMEERLWAALSRKHGVCRDDPSSWEIPLGAGLQPLKTHAVFKPIAGPAVLGALDDLIGEGRWHEPKHWGQFLVSFPVTEGGYRPRAIWHTDFPYFGHGAPVVGALVFSFVGEVPAGTGGTLVIAGSPRVVARFVAANPHLGKVKMKVTRQALMNSDPWLKALGAASDSEPDPEDADAAEDWAGRCMGSEHAIADIAVRVVELTGEPGDVVIGHPWLLHTPSPNHGDRPRFMRVQRIYPEVEARIRRSGNAPRAPRHQDRSPERRGRAADVDRPAGTRDR